MDVDINVKRAANTQFSEKQNSLFGKVIMEKEIKSHLQLV